MNNQYQRLKKSNEYEYRKGRIKIIKIWEININDIFSKKCNGFNQEYNICITAVLELLPYTIRKIPMV